MFRFIYSVVDVAVYLGCILIAAEVIKQLNLSRAFTRNTTLIGFLLSLALGSLIAGPISYGLSRVFSFLTRYQGESAFTTASEIVLGLVFLGGLLMVYNNWKKKM